MLELALQQSIGTLPIGNADYAAVPIDPSPTLGQTDNGQPPPPPNK
ncbi:MAG: hypothetical protein RL748_3266 [Pseudomonadota bacterium]|jgi:hypothetical protein